MGGHCCKPELTLPPHPLPESTSSHLGFCRGGGAPRPGEGAEKQEQREAVKPNGNSPRCWGQTAWAWFSEPPPTARLDGVTMSVGLSEPQFSHLQNRNNTDLHFISLSSQFIESIARKVLSLGSALKKKKKLLASLRKLSGSAGLGRVLAVTSLGFETTHPRKVRYSRQTVLDFVVHGQNSNWLIPTLGG